MEVAPEGLGPLLGESRRHEAAALARLTAAAWRFVLEERSRWGSRESVARDPEPAAHAIASAVAARAVDDVTPEVEALAAVQRADGGFGRDGGGGASEVALSARCGAALVGASRAGCEMALGAARRAIDFALATEERGGGWRDPVAGDVRATALAVELVAPAALDDGDHRTAEVARARRAGIEALLARQAGDGTWASDPSDPSDASAPCPASLTDAAIDVTADVIRAALAAETDDRLQRSLARAADAVARSQDASGSFAGSVVATIAGTRALLASARCNAEVAGPLSRAAERGMAWMFAAMSERGWGERAGAAADAAVTAGAIVLLAEYRALHYGDLAGSAGDVAQ